MKDETKLIRNDAEMKQLLLKQMMGWTYMVIALSEDLEGQLQDLFNMVALDPNVLGSSYFGRVDN
jgi:hypothetical protein